MAVSLSIHICKIGVYQFILFSLFLGLFNFLNYQNLINKSIKHINDSQYRFQDNFQKTILSQLFHFQDKIMFKKTIIQQQGGIETSRNPSTNYTQHQEISNNQINTGYNTQRYDRYPAQTQLNSQRKTITSGQFSQIKKVNQNVINKPSSELIIRQCDPADLNNFKKISTTPNRQQIQEINNIYQFSNGAGNSSNKKQRLGMGSRRTYDSTYGKQPLQQIHYSQRDNMSTGKSDRNSFTSNLYEPSNSGRDSLYYQMQQQMQNLKQYVCQIQQDQSNELKKTRKTVQNFQTQYMGELQNFANQISKELTKQKDDLSNVNKKMVDNQRDLRHFRQQYNSFVKDNQQKIESIVLDMTGVNTKKSRTNEQFGVDLKSSSQCIGGVGTSMSVNFQQSQNISMKIYNQMSAQLQVLKEQLQQCKQKIQLIQKDTNILRLQKKSSKEQPKQIHKDKIDLKQVQKMILQKFSQQRKKNQFHQKIQEVDNKAKQLYKVYQDMDSNIKGMNAEFTRVINGTVIKKQKALQAKVGIVEQKINQLYQKLNPLIIQQTVKIQVRKVLQQKSQKTKIIKIREPNHQQKQKLQILKSSEITYLLDQEGHLLDSAGNYLVQVTQNGGKQKIKIEQNLIYLLETQGIQIKTI